jgi:hypothetical protein
MSLSPLILTRDLNHSSTTQVFFWYIGQIVTRDQIVEITLATPVFEYGQNLFALLCRIIRALDVKRFTLVTKSELAVTRFHRNSAEDAASCLVVRVRLETKGYRVADRTFYKFASAARLDGIPLAFFKETP